MPRRRVEFRPGECYHVYNRGHNRQRIFFDRDNNLFFLRRLRETLAGENDPQRPASRLPKASEAVADVLCYCLMPNHYHLLLRLRSNELSPAMQRLTVSYAKAINKRQEQIGALFQGPFQAIHIDREEYLVYLSRYIHLNPCTARLVDTPGDWEFSSYREYVGQRMGSLPKCEQILRGFKDRTDYRRYCEVDRVAAPNGVEGMLIDN
jgi:REP element-mobilizing transposase RayT